MEFLRFGSSIPGSYWGCCAVDIIQNFKVDPDAKASIQLVDGDGGNPLTNQKGMMFAGPTWRDIFRQRMRIGTFSSREMPNHAFFAVLTESQISGNIGAKWLKILKEEGFEFLRTVDNSVYSGASLIDNPGGVACTSAHPNYIFALFRNIGAGAIQDPFTPPKAWTDLEQVVSEPWQAIPPDQRKPLNEALQKFQLERWKAGKAPEFFSEAELVAQGVPIWLAGKRSSDPQKLKPAAPATKSQQSCSKAVGGIFPVPGSKVA